MEAPNKEQTLVCWIGDTDLLAMARLGRETKQREFESCAIKILTDDKGWDEGKVNEEIQKLDPEIRESSIVLVLESKESWLPKVSTVILLTNRPSQKPDLLSELKTLYPRFINERLGSKFHGTASVKFVAAVNDRNDGVDAWDYSAVSKQTNAILSRCDTQVPNIELWYNITPGTIAQQIALILHGKALGSNNFIQVDKSQRRVLRCEIPFDIGTAFKRAIENTKLLSTNFCGKAPIYVEAQKRAEKAARYPVTVLLTGESGTGKEVFAREIHRMSGRKGKFIAINCAQLNPQTGVTELTGYFKGNYTGADKTTTGKYNDAIGGTLFLDEIGDCPITVQAELLRFLQPLRGESPIMRHWELKGVCMQDDKEGKKYSNGQDGDILVIAATNRDVRRVLRPDLFFRLSLIQIRIPSLEERKAQFDPSRGIDDIKLLANELLDERNSRFEGYGMNTRRKFDDDAIEVLRKHVWRGNIREMEHVIERIFVFSDDTTITGDIVKKYIDDDIVPTSQELGQTLEDLVAQQVEQDLRDNIKFEDRMQIIKKAYCSAALQKMNNNKFKAYTALGMNPKTFEKCLCYSRSPLLENKIDNGMEASGQER